MPLNPALYLISFIYRKDFLHLQGREALPSLLASRAEPTIPQSVYPTIATTQRSSRDQCVSLLNQVT